MNDSAKFKYSVCPVLSYYQLLNTHFIIVSQKSARYNNQHTKHNYSIKKTTHTIGESNLSYQYQFTALNISNHCLGSNYTILCKLALMASIRNNET